MNQSFLSKFEEHVQFTSLRARSKSWEWNKRWTLLLFAIGLWTLCGCQAFSKRTPETAAPNELAGGPSRLATVNSGQKADVCIATAAELARHGRDEQAIKEYLHAREFDARIKGVAHPLAVLYDRKGMADAAEREYQCALRETPKNADLLNDYGYFLYSRNDLDAAETTLGKALKLQPRHPKAQLNLALVLAERRQYGAAMKEFQAAVGEAAAHHNLAVILARHGEKEKAQEHLQRAARLDPSLAQSREMLSFLSEELSPGKALLPASLEIVNDGMRHHSQNVDPAREHFYQ